MKQSQSIKTILITWVILLIIAYFYSIKPGYEYSWWWMILHGPLIPANWVLSFFDGSKLCKAPLHTTMYNVFWWIACVCAVITTVLQVLSIITTLMKKK